LLTKITQPAILLGLILMLLLAACQANLGDSSIRPLGEVSTGAIPVEQRTIDSEHLNTQGISLSASTITLGDIDPEDPTKKIGRLQPLADYLAENLKEYGVEQGRVVIARDIEELATLIADGTIDVNIDSPFPSLQVQEMSGSKVVARGWKQNAPDYWSIYVARRDSGIDSVDDFLGKVVAFEEPHSTSGFILPAGTLVDRGLRIVEVSGPEVSVAPDEIGYFFALDEENTFELIFRGAVAGGAVSNQDFLDPKKLDDDLKAQLVAVDHTISVPRQFVSVGPGLDQEMTDTIVDLLAGLEHFEQGQQILKGMRKTKRYDALPPESEAAIEELERLIDLVVD